MAQSPAAPPPDALSELAESDAPQEIRTIYRDICRLSGIPLPALIWRHLGTHDGVLDAAWSALRPLFSAGLAQEAAWRTCRTVLEGRASAVTRGRLRGVHLPAGVEAAYERVLDSYNRANPVNVLAMRLLLTATSDRAVAAVPLPIEAVAWVPPTPIDGLPPMTPVAEIRVVERGRIDRLAADATIDRSRVVPSLYRHLVQWPALIRLMHDDLEPRMRSGEVRGLVAQVSDGIDAEVRRLAAHVAPLPQIAAVPGLAGTIAQFAGSLIPEMIVVGHLLRQGLDRPG